MQRECIPSIITGILLVCSVSATLADQILWQYYLDEIPPGWTAQYHWFFNPEGMRCKLGHTGPGYEYYDVLTDTLVVPEGTDSLTLSVQQEYSAWEYLASIGAYIHYWTDTTSWVTLWELTGSGNDSIPIFESISSLAVGTEITFRFRGAASSGSQYASAELDWLLYGLILTAHGDIQGLTPSTWGAIKASF